MHRMRKIAIAIALTAVVACYAMQAAYRFLTDVTVANAMKHDPDAPPPPEARERPSPDQGGAPLSAPAPLPAPAQGPAPAQDAGSTPPQEAAHSRTESHIEKQKRPPGGRQAGRPHRKS